MASSLKDLWKDGKEGCLSPLEQCRAWALREVYREEEVPEKKLYTKVASKLTKIGGGQPTPRAVLKWFAKVGNDDDWYPGKVVEGRGRKQVLTGLAKGVIKRSAEAILRRGGEPTYRGVCGACPEAVRNPETKNPVDKKRVYAVFRELCKDDGSDMTWENRNKLQKTALPDFLIGERMRFCRYMLKLPHTDEWYYSTVQEPHMAGYLQRYHPHIREDGSKTSNSTQRWQGLDEPRYENVQQKSQGRQGAHKAEVF